MNRRELGLWGEEVVFRLLSDHGFGAKRKGGQLPFDILILRLPDGSGVDLRVEVKTSKWKDEDLIGRDGNAIKHWGWLVQNVDKPEGEFDYLVCVAKPRRTTAGPRVFVFTRKEALSQPKLRREDVWKGKPENVAKVIHLFASLPDFTRARDAHPNAFSPLEEDLLRQPKRHEDAWWKIDESF